MIQVSFAHVFYHRYTVGFFSSGKRNCYMQCENKMVKNYFIYVTHALFDHALHNFHVILGSPTCYKA